MKNEELKVRCKELCFFNYCLTQKKLWTVDYEL